MSPFSLASTLQWRLQHEVVGANWVVNPPKLQEISAYFRASAVARRLQLLHQGCWGFVIVDWSSRILSRSFLKYRPSYIIIHGSRCISGGSLSRMSNSSWQIEAYMILIDVRSWLTFRRLELSQPHLEVLIPESWRIRHHVNLLQATIWQLQLDFQALEAFWIAFDIEVLFQAYRLDWHWELLFRDVALSWTVCHLGFLVQESWMTCHLNCISKVLKCPGLSG